MGLHKIVPLASLNLTSLALAAIVVMPSAAGALTLDGNKIGQIYKRSGPSVERRCAPTKSSKGTVPWSPANRDMVIVDYKVVRKSIWSRSGFSISEVPAKFDFQSYSEYLKEFDELIETAGKNGNQEYEARFKQEKREFEKAITKLQSSHGSIVLKWHCEGDGLFGGRGKVNVAVDVDVMYKPNLDKVSNYLRNSKQQLRLASTSSPKVPKIGVPNLMIQTPRYPVVAVFSDRKESFALGCPEIRNMWSKIPVKNVSSQEYNSIQAKNPVVADLPCNGTIEAYAPTNEPGALLIKHRNGVYYRHYIDSPNFLAALKTGDLNPIPVSEFRTKFPKRGTDFKVFR